MTLTVVPVANAGITSEQLAALILRDPDYRYRLWHSDISGAKISELPRTETASISLSNYRDHTWELTLPVREAERSGLDLFGGWVKAEVLLRDAFYRSGERWLSFAMGLYRFDFPKGSDSPLERTYDLAGKSPEALLLGDMAYEGYLAPAGAWILSTVRDILVDRGIPAGRTNFPVEDKQLTSDAFFDQYQDAAGCYWLRICNSLLSAGGFYALYTDRDGRFTTHEIESGLSRENVAYGTVPGTETLITDEIGWEYSEESFANRVVVYAGDPNEVTPVTGIAENNDPDSPISIPNYGVKQREPRALQNIVSQAEADKIALAQLRLNTSLHLTLNVPTLPDPRRGPREVYRLDARKEDGTVLWDGLWRVTNWTLPLNRGGMTHEISLNVDV